MNVASNLAYSPNPAYFTLRMLLLHQDEVASEVGEGLFLLKIFIKILPVEFFFRIFRSSLKL